jgi:hypothetical protein
MGDTQLAIAITRASEGDNGPVLREILEERVLPEAASEGNRWMASWAFWMLGRRDMAVRALIVSILPLTARPQLIRSSHRSRHSYHRRRRQPPRVAQAE